MDMHLNIVPTPLFEHIDLRSISYFCSRPRRKTKTLMKKDKYPLAGGLMSTDPSRPGSVGARDMYSGMNGYMPNGYGYDTSSMYSQSPYSSSHMSSSPSSIYSARDMYSGMYSGSASSASAMSSYMNGQYMSMYGGSSSPYSSMGQPPVSPGAGGEGEGPVSNHSHSPGSVKSEAGGSGPPTGSSMVSMGSGSPGSAPAGVPPGPPSGPLPTQVKREPMTGPPTPGGHQQQSQQQQELNRMISMYLPGDAAAAAAGDPGAQNRITQLQQQIQGGYYHSLMAGPPHPMSHSPDPMGHPPAAAYPV